MRTLSRGWYVAALVTVLCCGDDGSSPSDTSIDSLKDAGGHDVVVGEAGQTLGPNSGQTCDQSTPCPTGDECLLLQGWKKGMCFAKCTKQNDACTTADKTKYLSTCAMTDKTQTQWFCLYICEAEGLTYECPDPSTQECVASTTQGVKMCKPK
jgi:hypothetical protein